MALQYQIRKDREDWAAPATWVSFWFRRFFRLSPLYFLLLIVALLAGKAIYADRVLIDAFFQHPAQLSERYTDASPTNFIMHLTYLFGLFPAYAFRSALPDWSLGLEMQFYAVFPFAVLLIRRMGWIPGAVCICITAIGIALLAKLAGISFPMPSFLPLKMHMFLAGMLIAAATGKAKVPYFLVAVVLVGIPLGGSRDAVHIIVREIFLTGFFALIHWRSVPSIDRVARGLATPFFHWLGELSYGVYLIHLLIAHHVAVWAIGHWGHGISDAARFAVTFSMVAPITYFIAYVTYRLIEIPGQQLGKSILTTFGKQRQAAQTAPEDIAAP
jgi:peptidoglycan/LPS O-acetylase OafA/YrhL